MFTRRHVPELIHAFAQAARGCRMRSSCSSAPIGASRASTPRDRGRAGAGQSVEWREYVADAELDALYAGARVFAFLRTTKASA
jgi:hypothetical protein